MSAGATTLKREDLDRGLEADESYYLYDVSRSATIRMSWIFTSILLRIWRSRSR